MTCDYCKGSRFPGIHFPSNFDDREDSKDGKVFIAKCDECYHQRELLSYSSDEDAAKVIAEETGWTIQRSYDEDDAIDPRERKEKAGTGYYRPYFNTTLATAEKLMNGSNK